MFIKIELIIKIKKMQEIDLLTQCCVDSKEKKRSEENYSLHS